jgi:hypothetical protein
LHGLIIKTKNHEILWIPIFRVGQNIVFSWLHKLKADITREAMRKNKNCKFKCQQTSPLSGYLSSNMMPTLNINE